MTDHEGIIILEGFGSQIEKSLWISFHISFFNAGESCTHLSQSLIVKDMLGNEQVSAFLKDVLNFMHLDPDCLS